MNRASSSELAVWRGRIADREYRQIGSLEHEMWGALVAEREYALDMEARVREMAADRREMREVERGERFRLLALLSLARHRSGQAQQRITQIQDELTEAMHE